MSFNLPEYTFDNSQPSDGKVGIPAYTIDASQLSDGKVGVPVYTFNGSLPSDGVLRLPVFGFTEAGILEFTHVPSGGAYVGGGAYIVGDPVIPTGGVTVAGEGVVGHTYVLLFSHSPLGGAAMSGAAPNSFNWSEYDPLGGASVGGAAAVSSTLIQIYSIPTPTGGVVMDGHADVSTTPDGGVLVGGAAEVTAPSTLTHVPAGGLLLAGAAVTYWLGLHAPSGGAAIGGGATLAFNFPRHVPSGGATLSGAAVMYAIPAGAVYSAENPYYDPYPGWALNADTNGVSRYKGVVANSFCQLDGKTFLANAAGIYEVDGADDAGQQILAKVVLPKDDLGSAMSRRVALVWLGARSSGKLKLGVTTNDDEATHYSVDLSDVDGARGSKVKLGKGLDGRYWQFSIENDGGADFELSTFEYEPAVSVNRRGR